MAKSLVKRVLGFWFEGVQPNAALNTKIVGLRWFGGSPQLDAQIKYVFARPLICFVTT
jgi:hypothetical protein